MAARRPEGEAHRQRGRWSRGSAAAGVQPREWSRGSAAAGVEPRECSRGSAAAGEDGGASKIIGASPAEGEAHSPALSWQVFAGGGR
ncbi:MAG: hypothetical protein WAV20_15020 [Blastocatellia bacterium]